MELSFQEGVYAEKYHKYPEEKDIDLLFCEEECELTRDLTNFTVPDVKECDDVCELLGGPASWQEKTLFNLRMIRIQVEKDLKSFRKWLFSIRKVYKSLTVIHGIPKLQGIETICIGHTYQSTLTLFGEKFVIKKGVEIFNHILDGNSK